MDETRVLSKVVLMDEMKVSMTDAMRAPRTAEWKAPRTDQSKAPRSDEPMVLLMVLLMVCQLDNPRVL